MKPKVDKKEKFKILIIYLGYNDMVKKTISRYCPFNASLLSCRLGRVQPGEEAGRGEETAGRVPAQVGDREEEQEGDSLIDLLIDWWTDLLIDGPGLIY
jgi:hypothetical protein